MFQPWSTWHHHMETFSALLAICAGNSPVTGVFPTQGPVTRSFDVFFDLRLNKRLSKWVRSRNCGCLVTWFCYQLIVKPGNKTAAVSWPDPNNREAGDLRRHRAHCDRNATTSFCRNYICHVSNEILGHFDAQYEMLTLLVIYTFVSDLFSKKFAGQKNTNKYDNCLTSNGE